MSKAIVSLFAASLYALAALPASAEPAAGPRSQPSGPSATAVAARSAALVGVARVPAPSSPNASSFSHLDVASRPLLELPFATRQAAAGEPAPALSTSDCVIR